MTWEETTWEEVVKENLVGRLLRTKEGDEVFLDLIEEIEVLPRGSVLIRTDDPLRAPLVVGSSEPPRRSGEKIFFPLLGLGVGFILPKPK